MVDDSSLSSYDEIAGMYHDLWADWYLPAALPALERLFFAHIQTGARVLDVCCGSGHVTKELVARGYQVTGIDNSAELIALARRQLPQADFHVQDARHIDLPQRYDAALSTFDSLNHILTLQDLHQVFAGVHRALKPCGLLVFDVNLEEAYSLDLKQWSVDIKDNSVSLMRGVYDVTTKLAKTELIWFVRNKDHDCWQQRRSVVEQRCYSQEEILNALAGTGFQKAEAIPAIEAGVRADLGYGRLLVIAKSTE